MSNICDDLRAAILQAAMQGKLTKHSKDGLLDRKTLSVRCDTGNNAPFDIPDSWVYVKMGDVATHQNGYAFKPTDWKSAGLPIIRIQDLTNKSSTPHYTDGEGIDDKFYISKGDVLVSWSCTIDSFLYEGDDAVLNQHIFKVIFDKIPIDKSFYILGVKALLKTINSKRHGSTMTHITKKDYDSLLFPIPPLTEQKRIVEKVDELMARVADLEESTDALASLKKAFPDDIKASLLQYAMQGKLTKQLPEDGNAEDLLEEIKAEKEKLIAEGKIKKQKPAIPVSDEEIPFEIPGNWKWVRLSELFQFINGDRGKNYPSKNKLHASGEIPFISAINMQNGTVREDNLLYADRLTYDRLGSGKLNKDDFAICIRGSLGKYCKYPYEIGAIASSLVIARKYSEYIFDDYFNAYLQSPLLCNEIHEKDNGTAQPNLSAADLMNFLIPLPPYAEQKRISERLSTFIHNINTVGELIASE